MHVFIMYYALGVGSIRNLNFNDVEGSISWVPPQTGGVLGNMFYQLVVINNNTGQVIVNTTTTLTTFYFPSELCQVYVGQVTAHMGNIAGETVVQQHRTIGGECLIVTLCAYAQQGYAFSRVGLYVYIYMYVSKEQTV